MKKILTPIFFLLHLWTSLLNAQCITKDSIKNMESSQVIDYLESNNCDTIHQLILAFNANVNRYLYEGEFDQVAKIIDLCNARAERDSFTLASLENKRGNYYYIQDLNSQAIVHFGKSIDLLPTSMSDYNEKKMIGLMNLSRVYCASYQFDKGFENLEITLQLLEKNPNNKIKYSVYIELGRLTKNQDQLKKAENYYSKASNIEGISAEDKAIAESNQLGVLYFQDKYKESIEFSKTIDVQDLSNFYTQGLIYRYTILSHLKLGNIELAGIKVDEFGSYVRDLDSRMTELYQRTYAEYLNKIGSYQSAKGLFESSYAYNVKKQKANNIKSSLEGILVAEMGMANALLPKRFEKYKTYVDSLHEVKIERSVNQWETKFETKEKEFQIGKLELIQKNNELEIESKKRKIIWSLLGLVTLFCGLIILWRFNQKLKETNTEVLKSKKELELLHKEMKHRSRGYLTTAINLLSSQRRKSKTKELKSALLTTENRLMALSSVSALLDKTKHPQSEFKSLINDIIEDLTFQSEYDITKVIDLGELHLDEHQIITLALITNELVFNSLKYAFEKSKNPIINLSIIKSNGYIKYTYEDNGIGIKGPVKGTGEGKKLITGFVEQLYGTSEEKSLKGYHFYLQFPTSKKYG